MTEIPDSDLTNIYNQNQRIKNGEDYTMEIVKIETNKLISPEWNPREITEEELTKLKNSLEEFGYIEPIIVNSVNNHVVGGNQRLRALESLGYDEVDCVYVTIEDINREKACNVALNKISGDWDKDKLQVVLEEIELSPMDISLTGFDEIELTEFKVEETESEYLEQPPEIIEDNYQDENIEVTVEKGDLYQLGNHRLYCGDATKQESYSILTNKKEMDLLFTDPPYGMKKEKDGVLNDNQNQDDLLEFNKQWIPLSFKALKYNGSWYCWGIDESLMDIYSNILKPMIRDKKISFRNLITWDKGTGLGQNSPELRMYAVADEKCLFVMCGSELCQGFRVNAEDYSENMDTVRLYLETEINKLHEKGLNDKKIANALGYKDGRTVNHWYSKSQFALPTKENYESLREYGRQILKQDYDFLKQDYDELKQEFYSNRSYFNNTHDNMNNVWHFPRTSQEERESTGGHATPKPIQLCTRAIFSSSRENENVLDVFGGSGSTLIACEQLNRTCYMMELDPYYCQIIISRWETYTGEKATKINRNIKEYIQSS